MTRKSAPLALTMGDPAGCGPSITSAAWQARKAHNLPPFFAIADPRLYEVTTPIAEIAAPQEAEDVFDDALPVLPIDLSSHSSLTIGQPDASHAAATVQSIELAVALCLDGQAAAMITNPISKAVLYGAGFAHPGHTEFIAHLCSRDAHTPLTPVMMLIGGGLKVALVTIHMPLMSVTSALTPARLTEVARITHSAMRQDFGIQNPRLAFTGLNPHAGEAGTLGREEVDIINPTAQQLRDAGLNITDARPADTVFYEALNGQFDAVIAMTHDQGLIPVKTLDLWGGVNATLGLPILRTSPDHGTAYDAAAAGTCRPDSLIAAIKTAASMASHRAVHV